MKKYGNSIFLMMVGIVLLTLFIFVIAHSMYGELYDFEHVMYAREPEAVIRGHYRGISLLFGGAVAWLALAVHLVRRIRGKAPRALVSSKVYLAAAVLLLAALGYGAREMILGQREIQECIAMNEIIESGLTVYERGMTIVAIACIGEIVCACKLAARKHRAKKQA